MAIGHPRGFAFTSTRGIVSETRRRLADGLYVQTDVAIGVAGLPPLRDLRGTSDRSGYELKTTQIAVADEIAGAAELVMGKADGIPAAIVRGLQLEGDGSAHELVMPPDRDLFR